MQEAYGSPGSEGLEGGNTLHTLQLRLRDKQLLSSSLEIELWGSPLSFRTDVEVFEAAEIQLSARAAHLEGAMLGLDSSTWSHVESDKGERGNEAFNPDEEVSQDSKASCYQVCKMVTRPAMRVCWWLTNVVDCCPITCTIVGELVCLQNTNL